MAASTSLQMAASTLTVQDKNKKRGRPSTKVASDDDDDGDDNNSRDNAIPLPKRVKATDGTHVQSNMQKANESKLVLNKMKVNVTKVIAHERLTVPQDANANGNDITLDLQFRVLMNSLSATQIVDMCRG